MIQENIKLVEENIKKACEKVGRDVNEVTLIAVSKTKPYTAIEEALPTGVRDYGENKVQELCDKYEILPKDKCDYFGENDSKIPPSDLLYIGFWTDKGSADTKTLELLAKLKNKKIFLFGTAGFGGSDVYFEKILGQVKQSIDSSNAVIGEYMCQGKMPQSVRERYVKMKENPEHPANLDMLIANFDCALSHPDMDDLEKLKKIIKK